MGNNNVTPISYASSVYSNFAESLISEDEKLDEVALLKKADREFNIMLEDLLVNDRQFSKFKESQEDTRSCLAMLLLGQATLKKHLNSTKRLGWNVQRFCEGWNQGTPTSELITKVTYGDFLYSKGKFYQWVDNCWKNCTEADIKIDPTNLDFDLTLPECDFISEEVDAARSWAQSKLDECKAAVSEFDSSALVSMVKIPELELNRESNKIPCFSSVVNFEKGSTKPHKRQHCFTVHLPYDPVKDTTDLVGNFLSALSCSSESLAAHLCRFGCRTNPSLTLIIGPASSGKSTLCKVAQSLYGPFTACSIADKAGVADYDLVRTCFFDDGSSLNEEFVSQHPCSHLVFTSLEDPNIGDTYGGRKVFRLVLDAPVDSDAVNAELVSKLSTRKQLGSLLGWCFQNSPKTEAPGEISNRLMKIVMECGMRCGDPNYKNCRSSRNQDSDDSDDDDDEKEDQESSTKIFKLGATGVTEVTK